METPPAHELTLTGILSESEHILTTHSTHFITLSLLFLPLSFSLITTIDFINFLQTHHNYPLYNNILYILTVYLLSLCAIATITYSTHHASFGAPINFFTTLKSLTTSSFPIVTTAVISHSLVIIISLSSLLFVGFVTENNSVYFMWLPGIKYAIIIVIVTYFYVNWSLAFVVVVVESKLGFAALRRSSDLVKGVRSVSLLLFLYFGCFVGVSVWVLSDGIHALSGSWYVVFVMVLGCGLMMSFLRCMTVATVVLYNYGRVLHGEVGIDGLCDEKVTHVVEA